MAANFACFCIFLIIRRKSHILPVTTNENESFQAIAGMTTPEVYALDPRSDELNEDQLKENQTE